jgi:hypothetical protein
VKGFLASALVLVVLEVAGRNPKRLAGIPGVVAAAARRVLAPDVAGLRDFAGAGAGGKVTGSGPGKVTAGGRRVATLPSQQARQAAVRAG